jgi:Ca2+-binding RTX toxin-like protein
MHTSTSTNITDTTSTAGTTGRLAESIRAVARSRSGRAALVATALAVGGGLATSAPASAAPSVTARIVNHTLLVTGTNRADHIIVQDGTGHRVDVDKNADGTADWSFHRSRFNRVVVNALGGNDSVTAIGDFSIGEDTILRGGNGNDSLVGANGGELLDGGNGHDTLRGFRGDDRGVMGSGNDTFIWDPGDGSDTIEGRRGHDTMLFNGAGADENIDVSANGHRLRFFRDVASITMDANDVETVDFNARGGADNIVVNDLSGTDVTDVDLDLTGVPGGTGGDGQLDNVIVNGTNGRDLIDVSGDASGVTVSGLAATTTVTNPDPTDVLSVNGLRGNDDIDASTLPAGLISTVFFGGWGNDNILGSANAELLVGGPGHDALDGNQGDDTGLMGAGDDTFTWDPGDGSDVVEGGPGAADRLNFNGSGASENIDISANGPRARFFRDVGAIEMDTDDTEVMQFNGNGGADTVTVNDLTGTDVTDVDVNL